jgi:hypothetical protein
MTFQFRCAASGALALTMILTTQTRAKLDGDPAAIVNGVPIAGPNLAAALAEAAGAVILEEAVLDAELATRLPDLPAGAEDAERRALVDSLAWEAGVDESQAGPMLERLRAGRGLGPTRFAALLARNARLRALVAAEAAAPEDLAAGVRLELGERVRSRLITLRSMAAAGEVLTLVRAAGERGGEVLARLAVERGEDARSRQGGVMPALSPDDVSLPAALRRAIGATASGLHPEVLALDGGYGVLWIDGRTPGVHSPSAEQRAQAERRARARLERVAMDRLGREILAGAKVTVFDDALRWSWERARR